MNNTVIEYYIAANLYAIAGVLLTLRDFDVVGFFMSAIGIIYTIACVVKIMRGEHYDEQE